MTARIEQAPERAGAAAAAPGYRAIGLYAGGAALVLLLIFARLMNYDLRRDEQLYVAPALLLRDFDLYTDIFYNHTPLSAWLFRAVKLVTGRSSCSSRRALRFTASGFFSPRRSRASRCG